MCDLISEQDAVDFMRYLCFMFGYVLTLGLYALFGLHVYTFIEVVCPLIKKRLGTELGLVWIAVGLILLFNIVFNQFWAMVIKPGSPKD